MALAAVGVGPGDEVITSAITPRTKAIIPVHIQGCPADMDYVSASLTEPPESMHDVLTVIRFGGIVTFLGLHFGGRNVISLDVNDLIFHKISLVPTFAEPAITAVMLPNS